MHMYCVYCVLVCIYILYTYCYSNQGRSQEIRKGVGLMQNPNVPVPAV